jgi:hypothetical protein
MNTRDLSNLNFLMTASPETLLDWYNQASEDDILYATELLNAYENELNEDSFGILAPSTNTLQ